MPSRRSRRGKHGLRTLEAGIAVRRSVSTTRSATVLSLNPLEAGIAVRPGPLTIQWQDLGDCTSQSPRSGDSGATSIAGNRSAPTASCLNPLEAGIAVRRVTLARRGPTTVRLNPLEAGIAVRRAYNDARRERERSLNPLEAGIAVRREEQCPDCGTWSAVSIPSKRG